MKIISDILGSYQASDQLAIEVDRRLAIHHALAQAQSGDTVLIAGKGHEDYQIIGTKKFSFSDIKVVKEYFI